MKKMASCRHSLTDTLLCSSKIQYLWKKSLRPTSWIKVSWITPFSPITIFRIVIMRQNWSIRAMTTTAKKQKLPCLFRSSSKALWCIHRAVWLNMKIPLLMMTRRLMSMITSHTKMKRVTISTLMPRIYSQLGPYQINKSKYEKIVWFIT